MPTEVVYFQVVHAYGNDPDPVSSFNQAYDANYDRDDVLAAVWYENLPHRRFQRWWDEHGWSIVRNRDLEL